MSPPPPQDESKIPQDELLPLIQQNLSLKEQVEQLTRQNKLFMEQQNAQHANPQHSRQSSGQSHVSGPTAQPQLHTRQLSGSQHQDLLHPPHPLRTHQNQRSVDHNRRQSLVVSEARKAAHQRTLTPQQVDVQQRPQSPPQQPKISFSGSPGPISTPKDEKSVGCNTDSVPVFGVAHVGSTGSTGGSTTGSNAGSVGGSVGGSVAGSTWSSNVGSVGSASSIAGSTAGSRLGSGSHSRNRSLNSNFEFKFPPSPSQPQPHPQPQVQPQLQHQLQPPNAQPFSSHLRAHSTSSFSSTTHRRSNSYREQSFHKRNDSTDTSNFSSSRRTLFVPYLPQANIPAMVSTGLLVIGTLRVNKKNRSHAYVSTDQLDDDVFIDGSRDRNRALEGDTVAVELLNVDDVWAQKQEKEERKRLRESQQNFQSNDLTRSSQKKADDAEIEGQTLFINDEVEWDTEKPLYSGHVVAILERPAGQLFSGTLCLLRPSSQATKERQHAKQSSVGSQLAWKDESRPKIVWFKPTDKHIPLMAIPTEQAPQDLLTNPQSYTDRVFVAHIKRWPITSLHPFGTLIEELGKFTDENVAIKAILRDANFNMRDLSWQVQPAMQSLVESVNNVTGLPTIEGATLLRPDLAASLSEDGKFVNIHVLDLTPYIDPRGFLHKELKHKSVSVVCGNINSPLFNDEKTQAELALDIGKQSPVLTVRIACDGSEITVMKHLLTPSDKEISKFESIASQFKKARGFGDLNATVVNLDAVLSLEVEVKDLLSSVSKEDQIIIELEHAANSAVTSELLRSSVVGLDTIVRHQEEPLVQKFESFAESLRKSGHSIDTTNSGTIAHSIAKLPTKVSHAAAISFLKCLAPQKYSIASKTNPGHLGHYWYNLDVYTHFTRPLLRFADHYVARQVNAMLSNERLPAFNTTECTELSFKHDCAVQARKQAHHLAISESLKSPQQFISTVSHVGSNSFNVVVHELCVEKRVYCDSLPINSCEYKDGKLTLDWQKTGKEKELSSKAELELDGQKQTIGLFADVVVEIKATFGDGVRPTLTITAVPPV